MRSWWEAQMDYGWSPQGLPRGQEQAEYPLSRGVRYRVSMNPTKGHLLMSGTDHAYCGLTLAPDDEWLVNSGYDVFFWIVEDVRTAKGVACGDCTRWRDRWTRSVYADRGRPNTPKVSVEEWASLDAGVVAALKQFEMKARWVAGLLGAEIMEEPPSAMHSAVRPKGETT